MKDTAVYDNNWCSGDLEISEGTHEPPAVGTNNNTRVAMLDEISNRVMDRNEKENELMFINSVKRNSIFRFKAWGYTLLILKPLHILEDR